jgi:hypothetical protein
VQERELRIVRQARAEEAGSTSPVAEVAVAQWRAAAAVAQWRAAAAVAPWRVVAEVAAAAGAAAAGAAAADGVPISD